MTQITDAIAEKKYDSAMNLTEAMLPSAINDSNPEKLAFIMDIIHSICDKTDYIIKQTSELMNQLLNHNEYWIRQDSLKIMLKLFIIRPNGFFSDMTEFLKMAKKGTVNLFGDGNFRMNPIHGADLAKVCVNALESNDQAIEIGGPEVFTHNEIAELAFKVLNKKPKIKYMPEWMRKTIDFWGR